jgi:hypothetical protein
MFASRSLAVHLARGALGLGALVATAVAAPRMPWLALVSLPLALLALRGCPMCWTVGLVETVVAAAQGRRARQTCPDGRCSRPGRA